MTYQQALEWLFSQLPMFSRIGAAAYKPGLDTTIAIDNAFGNPHRRFKSIHIGGTNGKGSVSHTLASILQSQGYKTALYTSPHLVDFRERMRINGEMIPEDKVVEFVEKWQADANGLTPSFFELTMMMAFDWFASENVDYAVIEVGMGGRLDSTNVITPEACIITNISFDHNQFLGDTLPQIACEKAGIIKNGIPVLIGESEGEVREVFSVKAGKVGAPVTYADDTPRLHNITENPDGGWICTSDEGSTVFPLGGDYQKKNIETILHAVDILRERGIVISDRSVTDGISKVASQTGLQGRWMILGRNPLIIADTGHNVAGIGYNVRQLRRIMETHEGGGLHIVIGFVADKAIGKILDLLPLGARYYATNARIPRALPSDKLMALMSEAGFDVSAYPDVASAFKEALAAAATSDVIFVGGSTFIVADLLSHPEILSTGCK